MLTDLLALTPVQIVLCILIIFIAYVVKGLSGFGSGLIAIPLLAFMLPLTYVVPLLGLLSYSGTIMQSMQLRKQVAWRDIWPLLPFSIFGVVVAIWLLVTLDPLLLIRALGVFVFVYACYSLLPKINFSGSRLWAIPAGGFAGVVGALFGTGGPFYVIYLRLRQLDKNQFRASIAMLFLIDGGVRIAGYTVSGLYTVNLLLMLLLLLPVLFLAMYTGNHLHLKLNQHRFNQLVSSLLLISGLMLVYKSFAV